MFNVNNTDTRTTSMTLVEASVETQEQGVKYVQN